MIVNAFEVASPRTPRHRHRIGSSTPRPYERRAIQNPRATPRPNLVTLSFEIRELAHRLFAVSRHRLSNLLPPRTIANCPGLHVKFAVIGLTNAQGGACLHAHETCALVRLLHTS